MKFKKKISLKWLLASSMLILPILSYLTAHSVQALDQEAITTIENPALEDGYGSLQIQKFSSTPGIANIDNIRELENATYTVYADKDLTQTIKTLTTNESGFTLSILLKEGTYYVKETETSKRYALDDTVYTVNLKSDTATTIHSKSDPQLTTIDESEWGNPIMPFAASHKLTTTTEYGVWNLRGEGAYGQQSVLKIDGKIAFCLEGEKSEVSGTNQEVSFKTLGMDSYKSKLVLMAYYGYYSQRSATNYYLTQNLIWDEIMRVQKDMGWQVYATNSSYSSLSSMQSFFSSVRSKVNSFNTKPSFDKSTQTVEPGQVISVTDSKKVLSDCYIFDKNGTNASISGNTLKVTAPTTPGTYTIKIKRGASSLYGNTLFAVRYNSSSQAVSCLKGGVTWDASIKIVVKESKGTLSLTKSSANTAITNNNDCYSLAGAVYGVYSDAAATKKVAELTVKENGTSNTVELTKGTYYLKEITAPKGYALDKTIYPVLINAGKPTTKALTDIPQSDPVAVLLGKIDKETNQNKPQGSASLANAQFTVKYYDGLYDVDPATQAQTPVRTWILKTDVDGFTYLDQEYKVSGDDFYIVAGYPTLPIGTITIQETKAPTGYHINPEIFIRKITSSGNAEWVNTYNQPIVPETVVKFNITKYERGTTTAVKGVTFEHTKPNGVKETLTTNSSGKVEIVGLETGKHTIKEISTIDGLIVNPNVFTFTINADGSITNTTSDLNNKLFSYSVDGNGNGNLIVYNDYADFTVAINKLNDINNRLAGATFVLYEDANCTKVVETLTTNESGYITFKNLDIDKTYYLRETDAPAGYRLSLDDQRNPVTHTIKIERVSAVNGVFDFIVDGVKYTINNTTGSIRLEGTLADRRVTFDVINQRQVQLPATGSNTGLTIITICVIVAPVAIFGYKYTNKKKEKNEENGENNNE